MAIALRPKVTPTVAGFLRAARARYRSVATTYEAPLRFGVDLGTATIVLTAIDAAGAPIYWDHAVCRAVRDGVVVDFAAAVAEVRRLRVRAEEELGQKISAAATAYPPGIPAAEARACRYVLEQSEMTCRALVDEVSAAQALVRVTDGAVADVGGGSTGVGVYRDGSLVTLSDAAGGGHHLDLILAGALHISIDAAEALKRTSDPRIESIVRPGIERIAASIGRQIGDRAVDTVHLVGGALTLAGAAEVVGGYLGIRAIAYPHAELITPFGMASCDG